MTENYIDKKVIKGKNYNELLKFYVKHLKYVYQLTDSEMEGLVPIFMAMTSLNTVYIDASLSKNIQSFLKVSQPTASRIINGLIKKQILRKPNNDELKKAYEAYAKYVYFVDPIIVGQRPFRDVKQIVWTTTKEYDFENLEIRTYIKTDFSY